MGWAFAPGPDVGRVLDLPHILTELRDRLLPVDAVASFVQEVFAILRKRPVELLGSHLPHLFHRSLPFMAEFEPCGSLIQRREQSADHPFDLGLREHAHAGLDDEILVKEEYFRTDARFVRRRIIGSRQFFQGIA